MFKSFRRKRNVTVVAACLRYSIVAHYHSAHFGLRWFDESFRRSLFHLLRPCEFTKITIIQHMRRLLRQNVHQQGGGIYTVRIIPIWHHLDMLVRYSWTIIQDNWRHTCSHYSTMMIPNLFTVCMRRPISTLLRAHATKLLNTEKLHIKPRLNMICALLQNY